MKSIRLSLVLYFLVLVALSLGAVSALAYWSTARVVEAREETTRDLLRAQHKRRCDRERHRLDSALLFQARTLASLANFQFQGNRVRYQMLAPIGMLTAGPGMDGFLMTPFWAATSCRGPLAGRMVRLCGTEIQFNEGLLPPFPDGPVTEFLQITSEWGHVWRSHNMDDFTLDVPPRAFEEMQLFDPKFDELTPEPDIHVRRVTLKVPASRFRFVGEKTKPVLERPEFFLRPPSGENVAPALLIQIAYDTARRDATLATYQEDLSKQIEDRQKESQDTLAALRNQLLAIGVAAFAATVAGGIVLVRLGLAPLSRLSDAVSKVSAKDCRLQFDGSRLPVELRPIAEGLEQAFAQLQRAFAREKQAAADISHELRTPLAALLTTTEVALRKPRSAEQYRESLGDCHAQGKQMSQLVERLLSLARLDAGVDTLRYQEVDAAALAEQCAALVRPLAEAHDLTLRIERNGPACLSADPDKLREVLNNLLHNAIEYNQPRGSVALKVERVNGHLDIEVKDTGIGIAPEARGHIFERFYRVDPSRQATGLHAGLGLAIVKGYVDLMGGSISVESVVGQGSTFRLSLPTGDFVKNKS